jgi:flavin reductase (DIM6/NTAB) family NADH-FMN oxidoreductase RutF
VIERREPDGASFRAALGSMASSVAVITMRDEFGRPLGMTATAFSSVSADPLLVMVCVNRSARSCEQIRRGGRFGVNILPAQSRELSDYCARPGDDKILRAEWLTGQESWRTPALRSALAYLDCEIDQDVVAGTHAVLIGAVKGIGMSPSATDEPLIHFRGRYRGLTSSKDSRRPAELPVLIGEF